MPIRIHGVDYESTINSNSSATNQIGTYHMADNANQYEIQRSNNFEFIVPNLEVEVRGNRVDAATVSDVIRLSVVSADIPHFSQSAIPVQRGNSTIKFAGVPTFNGGNIVLNDYIGADTLEILQAWQDMAYNPRTEKVGVSGDYKKKCVLFEYSPDYQLVRAWDMYGCWISSISEDTMNNEGNNKHTVTIKIEYDHGHISDDYNNVSI